MFVWVGDESSVKKEKTALGCRHIREITQCIHKRIKGKREA